MTKPINPTNAIETANFIVAFQRNFTPTEIDVFLGLKERLSSELPSFNTLNTLILQSQDNTGAIPVHNLARSGVLMQQFRPDGKPAWALKIDTNQIIVSCLQYSRWSEVLPKAIRFLSAGLSTLTANDLNVQVIVLEIVDRFAGPTSEYTLDSTFKSGSKYLTSQARESGLAWHIHQGWFEPATRGRVLNHLNLASTDTDGTVSINIQHVLQHILSPALDPPQIMENEVLQEIFEASHTANKNILKDLLNTKQLEAIGLK